MSPPTRHLSYFFSDAWDECRHSPGVNLLATATLGVSLFVAGLALLMLSNVGNWVERLRGDLRVDVFLQDEIDPATWERLAGELADTPGVARVEYVAKDEALRRFRSSFGDLAGLTAELDSNPLPASLEVFLKAGPNAGDSARLVVGKASGQPGVEEVRFDREWLDRLDAMLDVARWGGSGLALLVFIAVAFVMASVLRLAVHARRDEIDIMLLVGATPAFVRGPFLVAGLVQGLLASGAALAGVELARRLVRLYTTSGSEVERLTRSVLVDLVAARPITPGLSLLLVAIGVTVGLTGAFFAVRRTV